MSMMMMMRVLSVFVSALLLLCTVTSAFVTPSRPTTCTSTSTITTTTAPRLETSSCTQLFAALSDLASEVDQFGNNVKVKELLERAQQKQLLTRVAQSGLLRKAQAAGISLAKLEPLLSLAASNPEILVLVEASGPDVLNNVLPTVVDVAPAALPVLATAVSIPAPVIAFAGIATIAGAAAAVYIIPDDSVVNVAVQTLIVGLSVPVAGAALAGSALLSQLTR